MIILCGASASGKTEVAKYLQKKFNIKKAVTNTTRNMRINEVDGVDYYFLTKEEFFKLRDNDLLVEYTEYNGNYYGCSKKEVRDDKVVILEPSGVNSFLKLNDPHIVIFYLETSKEIRKQRMISRGDDINSVNKRLELDDHHFDKNNFLFPYILINTDNISIEDISHKIMEEYNKVLNK
jgi:guanylate kinase